MPDEKPDNNQEKHRIFARAADIAKNVVDESAKAMSDESKRIDNEQYELSDMIATVTRVANAGIAGATELARIPLEERWPEKHLVLGEYVSTVVRRMVNQAGKVAQTAANDVEGMTYTPRRWLESMTRLIDIAVAGGMDIAETLGAGPAEFQSQPIASAYYTVPDSNETRELTWAQKPTRDAGDDKIADYKLRFDPPTLLPGSKQFRVLVNATGLISGVYKGKVRVGAKHVEPIQIEL
jgi:hypothetical protein